MAENTQPQMDFPEDQEFDLMSSVLATERFDEPLNLLILDESETVLPASQQEVKLFKILNQDTGNVERLAINKRNNLVDYEELVQHEHELVDEQYGAMQVALYDLVEIDDQYTFPVLIKYAIPEEFVDKSAVEQVDDLEALQSFALEANRQVEHQAAELHREILSQFNLSVADDAAPFAVGPFVSADLPADAIRELARDPRVAFIGLDQEQEVPDYPTISESLPTTRTDWVHNAGTRGAGVKIAVLEGGGLTVNQACFRIGAIQNAGASPNSHMTKSVGIIGNRYSGGGCSGNWQGYAPEATVLIANDSDYTKRYEWAKNQGVNVVTMSWHFGAEETDGSLHSRDVFFDYWATRYPYPSIFTSAGNQAPDAYASGKGYNSFGVANVLNDGDGNRCNDVISSSSSYKDPTSPHSDREIPEIAAPGSRHELLGTSFGGTSCATPVTASIAALLMSKNGSLKNWPEAIRAILLATANYQDADGTDWARLSEGKDGTGLINTRYASYTAGRRETGTTAQFRAHDYGSIRATDFVGGFFKKSWKAKTGTTNSRIRVAITWNSKVTATSSVLDADLDLWVYDPDGGLVAWSTTYDSNYEFVEFTPSKAGDYTIKIRGMSVPGDFQSYYGVAWTTHYDLCT